MRKQLIPTLVFLQLAALLLCGPSLAADYPLTVTDTAGREVAFPSQ